MKSNRKVHILLLCLGCAVLAGIFCLLRHTGHGIHCLIYERTGYLCPGCGNSRAVMALLQLQFREALGYNPLFPLEFGYIAWVYIRCCREYLRGGRFTYRPPVPWMDTAILIIVVLWGILRNFL